MVQTPFPARPAAELRALSDALRRTPGVVAVLSAFDGDRLTLLVACSSYTRLSARDLLLRSLSPFNGRDGGDPSLAQGGGPLPDPAPFLAHVNRIVEELARERS